MSLLGSGLDTGGGGLAAPPRMELPAQEESLLWEQKGVGRARREGGAQLGLLLGSLLNLHRFLSASENSHT